MMHKFKAYWMTVTRKAKWLMFWCAIYSIPAAIMIGMDMHDARTLGELGPRWKTYGWILQVVWLFIISMPLWIRPIGDWVFKRGKHR